MKTLKVLSTVARLSLTAWLLYVVWHNAHWSVALAVTMLSVSMELNTVVLHLMTKTDDILMEAIKKMSR